MKGIVLAGGSGTRLHPITASVSKQLVPVYDKPMIYYPLSILLLGGIRDILIISAPSQLANFKTLLGHGDHLGVNISYEEQPSPDGLAQALLIGEKFLDGSPCCLILGDNFIYGNGIKDRVLRASQLTKGAKIFTYKVNNPSDYGVAEIVDGKVLSIEEKPHQPKSNDVVTGIYFYDCNAPEFAKQLAPSSRGEIEISDLNCLYLQHSQVEVERLGRGDVWIDLGTPSRLLEASFFVQTIQERQGQMIACLEEICLKQGWIDSESLVSFVKEPTNAYYRYVLETAYLASKN